ncbi:histidine kinase [Opitutus sp. ER46]|uniref:sensor histidine kinase n=1 Tax=Opitutus sp. ER46 TaxID=2161864 RepID=UPI000D2F504B|nr:histidine kinase [Opitutus sp. ER46]
MSSRSSASVRSPARPGRDRTKERLYVICQSGSWLLMLGLQLFFSLALMPRKKVTTEQILGDVALVTMVIALGWLISHGGRMLVARWGWKQLSWRALAPRILAMSAAQSVVWAAIGYGYPYLVLGLEQPAQPSIPMLAMISWINGTIIFTGWWFVYFFYHLSDRFKGMQIEQLRLASAVKEAELRALKSQVNPHFMFNALNSVRALIDEDPARARLAVTQLANLLRYSLQSAQAETVPFEDELRVVNDYLALEQVRHEERLRLKLDIAPETLGLAVPPLVLQTLVENAVKYGISPRPEGGVIEITAWCEHGELRLRVTNPGDLATEPTVVPSQRSTGLGLKNTAERLRLRFGEAGRLRVWAERAKTLVVAEVTVPAQSARA